MDAAIWFEWLYLRTEHFMATYLDDLKKQFGLEKHVSVSYIFDSPSGTNQTLGMCWLVWVDDFRLFGHSGIPMWQG